MANTQLGFWRGSVGTPLMLFFGSSAVERVWDHTRASWAREVASFRVPEAIAQLRPLAAEQEKPQKNVDERLSPLNVIPLDKGQQCNGRRRCCQSPTRRGQISSRIDRRLGISIVVNHRYRGLLASRYSSMDTTEQINMGPQPRHRHTSLHSSQKLYKRLIKPDV